MDEHDSTTYISSEDMINKLQELKGKTKLKFFKKMSSYYDEMNIRNFESEEDPSVKMPKKIAKFNMKYCC